MPPSVGPRGMVKTYPLVLPNPGKPQDYGFVKQLPNSKGGRYG